jgi:HlyD family secretion protein
MSASVDIMTNKVINVIAVPIQSVTTREQTDSTAKKETSRTASVQTESSSTSVKKNKGDEKPNEVVFLVTSGTAKVTKVSTGIQDDEYIEIKTGLTVKNR